MAKFLACILGALVVLLAFPDHSFVQTLRNESLEVVVVLLLGIAIALGLALYVFYRCNRAKLERLGVSGKWADYIALFKR
ncbi:hypothetical protein [Chitinibacter sp. ZOR0017]|uniref:hypothetical protein n=1 Tax=Chitinibacter sp. ZOR0017 TaxID=1339254 RepID=UPI000647584E|nr:hypothetical protein [Chitinibacter sp. ZOR0017]